MKWALTLNFLWKYFNNSTIANMLKVIELQKKFLISLAVEKFWRENIID